MNIWHHPRVWYILLDWCEPAGFDAGNLYDFFTKRVYPFWCEHWYYLAFEVLNLVHQSINPDILHTPLKAVWCGIAAIDILFCRTLLTSLNFRRQRPPADDEDFPFAHEGSGREVRGPLSSHSEPVPPPSQAEVYGNEVSRRRQQPDFRVEPPTYHGSGHGDDDEYAYDDEDDYYDYGGEYEDEYYDDDYGDEEYGDYGDTADGQESAGGPGQDQHRTPTDRECTGEGRGIYRWLVNVFLSMFRNQIRIYYSGTNF